MFFQQWEILLVDDEPDVLSVSKLAMKGFDVYGLPLRIHTASSKAEALELLNSRPGMQWSLAVAFIDVVMESDTAGLELCQAIREDMGNKLTQLFIRTGQPGVAPEREVIDRYDINGYFTKAEATEDKLYSLVKSGVRQFFWSMLSMGAIAYQDIIIRAGGSRTELADQFRSFVEQQAAANENPEFGRCYMVNDTVIDIGGWDESKAREMIGALSQLEGTPLGDHGDRYVVDGEGHMLIKVGARPDSAEVNALVETEFTPPPDAIYPVYRVLATLGLVWERAA
jgi:CheY-like chemotaxis protein